jgi:Carbohydrate binding module (family 35)
MTNWASFGFSGDVIVRDLWDHTNLVSNPDVNGGYKFTDSAKLNLNTRQSALVKVTPLVPLTQYLADAPGNTVTCGTHFPSNNAATDGRVAGFVGNGGSVIFNNIKVPRTGSYSVNFLYFNGDPSRPASISVNGGAAMTINFPGTGSFQRTGTLTSQLQLSAGNNSVTMSAPGNSYPASRRADSPGVRFFRANWLTERSRFREEFVSWYARSRKKAIQRRYLFYC